MAELGNMTAGGSDDNGFEKVHHTDISPSTPPQVPGPFPSPFGGGVEELYGVSGSHEPLNPPSTLAPTAPPAEVSYEEPAAAPNATSVDASAPIAHDVGSKMSDSSASDAPCSGCSWVKSVDPRVLDLIYWRDAKKSGAVLVSLLVLLISLSFFSLVSVLAYLSLALLTLIVGFRFYRMLLAAVKKSGEGNPFKKYLEKELDVPEEKIHKGAEQVVKAFLCTLNGLKQLFLVADMIDSLKFGLVLWTLTYVGGWLNGLTLFIIALLAVFSLPKVYEVYKVQIDRSVDLARTKLEAVYKQVREKLPLPGKKKQA